jgi:hypothetical protein
MVSARAKTRIRGEKGWNFRASTRWPRSKWARARVRPQEGQGMPVTARSGHKTKAWGDVTQSKARNGSSRLPASRARASSRGQ